MMPIMSALQQGGCYPSGRLMLEKQRIFTTAFVDGGFLSATPLICVCLEGFGPIVLSSGLSGSLRLCLSSPFSFSPSFSFCLLPVEPRLQVEWCRYENSPSTLAQHAKPRICLSGSPPLPPLLLLPPPPLDPWEQEVYLVKWWMGPLLLLRGKGKKAFLSLQGSQMSLAVSKLRVGSVFWELLGTLRAWAPGSHRHFSIMCAERNNGW